MALVAFDRTSSVPPNPDGDRIAAPPGYTPAAGQTRPATLGPAATLGLVAILGPVAILALGALAMGISPLFVRAVSGEVGPFASAFWRVFLALPVLFAWMRMEERGRPSRPLFTRAAIFAGLAFAGDLFFWHLAILNTTVANATFFATLAPVFVVLFAWLAFRVRPSRATLAGLALCLGGGAALIGQSVQVAPGRLPGDLSGIVTAFFFALYFLFVERARTGAGAARVTFVLSLVTAATLLAVAAALDRGRFWPQTGAGWSILLALAWISHAGGQGLLSVALGRLPVAFSALVIFLEALFAAAAAWIVLGEPLTAIQIGGGVLILCGIWTARPRSTPARAVP